MLNHTEDILMGLNKVNTLENCQIELEFSVERSVFDEAVTKIFKKKSVNITVPGFRRGKAPRNIIEKMYGKGVFYEDALNEIIPSAYEGALAESGFESVSRPEFDVTEIGEEGVSIKAKFYKKPEAEISDYNGIEAERIVYSVCDHDLENEIERVRNRNSRQIDITDRAVLSGDTVDIDYLGTVDGVPFEGGKAEKYSLKIGSNSFIPGFEDQLIGHSIGENFDINVKFPEDYNSEKLAGADAVFNITLNGIKYTELPELDDEFAKDVSEFDTLDEYKADVKAKLQERREKNADTALEESLMDGIIARTTVELPASMVDMEIENIIRDRDYSMRSQGLNLDMYMKYTGMTLETMREQVRPQAERQIKVRLALEKIAVLENIAAEESDITAEYERLAAAYNMEVDKVKEAIAEESLKRDICVQKAVALIKKNAVITERVEEHNHSHDEHEEDVHSEEELIESADELEEEPETGSESL